MPGSFRRKTHPVTLARVPFDLNFELDRALKAHPKLRTYPIINMSADYDSRTLMQACLDNGHVPVAYEYRAFYDDVRVYILSPKKDPDQWIR